MHGLLCSQVAHDVVREYAADGVVYLELRSTPRANPNTGVQLDAHAQIAPCYVQNKIRTDYDIL